MSSIKEKIKKFETNCLDMSDIESRNLEEQIEKEIEEKIKEEIEEYKKDVSSTLERKIRRLEKNYNSEVFEINNDARKKIIEKKEELNKEIKEELKSKMIKFTDQKEYETFLTNNIKQAIKILNLKENDILEIGLTSKDTNKFQNIIKEQFKADIFIINDKYIGGAICNNVTQNISVNNTLDTISEEIVKSLNI